jgi:hypothetical protein
MDELRTPEERIDSQKSSGWPSGEHLLHPLQISFCIVRELHRRQPFSRSTDRFSE